jgi:hypothetical protein
MSLLFCVAAFAAPFQIATPVTLEAYATRFADESQDTVARRWPLTVAESSGFTRSSTLAEVETFLGQLEALPGAERLTREVFGKTTEGRELTVVTVRSTEDPSASAGASGESTSGERRRVLVNANIHGGEIEGKVVTQILLRELTLGYHPELLDALDIAFVPVFNADGNDRIARTNRVTQNGPDGGVGERANAAGLDLNRDFVKLETPEVRALTTLIRETAPHAFMDLHTTNGSPHGYDLTYASSLSPNVDPALAAYMAESFFPRVRKTLRERDGVHIFDYGNFGYAPRERGSRGERGEPIRWSTYDSRPRFGTNLMGLRGTLSILSEAYSYLSYERRVEATYAFVLECLRVLAADAGRLGSFGGDSGRLGVEAALDSVGAARVRVSRYEEVTVDVDPTAEGVQGMERRVAPPAATAREVEMDVQSRFRAGREVPFGREFLVLEPSAELLDVLAIHLGSAALQRVGPGDAVLTVQAFVVDKASRSDRVFQGHREASVKGHWEEREISLPPGALRVRANVLVAQLLHPESDDSLTTWNFFDDALFDGMMGEGTGASDGAAGEPDPSDTTGEPKEVRTHPVYMIQ